MRNIFLAVVIVCLATLQVTFLASLRPWGVVPNLMLVAVLVTSIYLETSSALALALGGGLIADLASGGDFGLRMGAYGLIVLITTAVRRGGLELRQLGLVIIATIFGSLAFDGLILASLALAGGWHVNLATVLQRATVGVGLNLIILGMIWSSARRLLGGDRVRAGARL